MKKMIILLLCLALTVSMTACAASDSPVTTAAPQTTAAPDTTAAPETTAVPETTASPAPDAVTAPVSTALPDSALTFLNLYVGNGEGIVGSMSASDNGDGTVTVEYVVDEKKVGVFGTEILADAADALAQSGLAALNGQDVYNDGSDFCSMYAQFADGSYLAASFSGTVDPAFATGFDVMDAYFAGLTASLPVYVPQAMVMGEVDAAALEEMNEILNNSGMEYLDSLAISNIPLDAYFGLTAGLSGCEGLTNGTVCAPMMNATAYSLVIVTLEDAESAAGVHSDFAANLGWRNWVCVAPEEALIARKGNMVLCLMGSAPMFAQTADAIENAGWTELEFFSNPDLE